MHKDEKNKLAAICLLIILLTTLILINSGSRSIFSTILFLNIFIILIIFYLYFSPKKIKNYLIIFSLCNLVPQFFVFFGIMFNGLYFSLIYFIISVSLNFYLIYLGFQKIKNLKF